MRRAPALTLLLTALSATPYLSACDTVDPYTDRFACTRNADCIDGFVCSPRSPRICIREGETDDRDTGDPADAIDTSPDTSAPDLTSVDTSVPEDTAVSDFGLPDADAEADTTGCPWSDPALDLDGDGIPSGVEDTNGNCVVDAWEFSPLEADTDNNGVADSDEPYADACTSAIFDTAPLQSALGLTFTLDESWSLTDDGTAYVAFDRSDGVAFGWAVIGDIAPQTTASDVHRSDGAALAAVYPSAAVVRASVTSLDVVADPSLGTWARERAVGELGSPALPSAIRDAMAGAVLGTVPSPSTGGTECSEFTLVRTTSLLDGDRRVSAGLVACSDAIDAELGFAMADLEAGSLWVPSERVIAESASCQALAAPRVPFDVLLIVDNSRSMAEFADRVSNGAVALVDALRSTGLQWRFAVTTTEAYLLESGPVDHDELLDAALGIRGSVYRSNDATLDDELAALVATDTGCMATDSSGMPVGSPDQNLCGSDVESGIDAALFATAGARSLGDDSGFRAEVPVLAVIVSDEDDARFEMMDGSPLDDVSLASAVATAESELGAANLRPFVIAADPVDVDVSCPTLDELDGVVGVEPALGYGALSDAAGGFGTLCSPSIEASMNAAVSWMLSQTVSDELRLPTRPIPASIQVTDRGSALPRSRASGWDLADDGRTILIFGRETTTSVAVGYRTLTD